MKESCFGWDQRPRMLEQTQTWTVICGIFDSKANRVGRQTFHCPPPKVGIRDYIWAHRTPVGVVGHDGRLLDALGLARLKARNESMAQGVTKRTSYPGTGRGLKTIAVEEAADLRACVASCQEWRPRRVDDGGVSSSSGCRAWRVGDKVVLAGLLARPDLNGRSATVIATSGPSVVAGRLRICIQGTEELANVRPGNAVLIPDASNGE